MELPTPNPTVSLCGCEQNSPMFHNLLERTNGTIVFLETDPSWDEECRKTGAEKITFFVYVFTLPHDLVSVVVITHSPVYELLSSPTTVLSEMPLGLNKIKHFCLKRMWEIVLGGSLLLLMGCYLPMVLTYPGVPWLFLQPSS